MSLRTRALPRAMSLAAALVLGSHVARSAGAPESAALIARPRIEAGSTLGSNMRTDLSIDGGQRTNEGTRGSAGVSARYSQGFLPYFGAVVLARFGSESSGWSEQRDETRLRGELAIGPELWLSPRSHKVTVDLRFAIPIGPTWTRFEPTHRDTMTEEYSVGHGVNFGVVAGAEVFWKHHGCYLELAYVRQLTWMTHRATLASDSTVRSAERYRYDQQSAVLGFGYAYRF